MMPLMMIPPPMALDMALDPSPLERSFPSDASSLPMAAT